ncbi:hypothetical protein CERSUDRAFT_72161 [Gelatoporia subvermispora B]|uniref:Uncharacterized protein n=1 Tax=Ceriporiopsis subvermispora (strain B) TaxID=914234 RepID=M2R2Y4_CERS8|nr:hypothetical protein CERSUDRAFT_72161 [Gelatoporia subvermispora B]
MPSKLLKMVRQKRLAKSKHTAKGTNKESALSLASNRRGVSQSGLRPARPEIAELAPSDSSEDSGVPSIFDIKSEEADSHLAAGLVPSLAAEDAEDSLDCKTVMDGLLLGSKEVPGRDSLLYRFYKAGHTLHHFLGPCVDTYQILTTGAQLERMQEGCGNSLRVRTKVHAELDEMSEDVKAFHLENYRVLLEKLDRWACCGRNDELALLKQKIILYMPKMMDQGIQGEKGLWGFNNFLTARLLCPQTRLSEFDEDPQAQIPGAAVRQEAGQRREDRARAAVQSITAAGPRTADKNKCGWMPGKPSRATKTGMTKIEAHNVAYMAAMQLQYSRGVGSAHSYLACPLRTNAQ